MKIGAYLLWAVVAVAIGLFVLLGYFIDHQVILSLRLVFMRWAVLLAAVALFVGLFNLLSVHWSKVSDQEPGWPYSAVLIVALLVTLVLGLVFGPDNDIVILLFNYIHLPIEASLMALLAVSLAFAGFRIVTLRRDLMRLGFGGTAFLSLLGTSPWPIAGESQIRLFFGNVRNWLAQVWAAGGARGIVLGVALGAVVTGLRVLLAVDRPYGD